MSLKLAQYTWDKIIKNQLGYSFSIPHTLAYSIEAVQEANLAMYYNPLFWDFACLSVNSGATGTFIEGEQENEDEDEEEISEFETPATKAVDTKEAPPDYGKIARAVAEIQSHGINVSLPDINKAEMDFIPDLETNSIIYSLKAVTGVNSELASRIISGRPYSSFEDFAERVNPTNLQMLNMIKAGCFDALYPDKPRKRIMRLYLEYYANSKVERKSKLTLANFAKMAQFGIIPQELELAPRVINFKKWVDKEEYEADNKRYLIASDPSTKFFKNYYLVHLTAGKDYDKLTYGYAVKQAAFRRTTDKLLTPMKEWLTTENALEAYYKAEKEDIIETLEKKYCQGSVSSWEMAALHYYYHEHELAHVNTQLYKIKNFNDLPEELVPKSYRIGKNGEQYPVYELCNIAGTVINADNNKHIVTLLTHNGAVVDVKFFAGSYIYYNKAISAVDDQGKKYSIEKSWFTRGNLLLISGARRELSFVPKRDWDSGFKHTVQLITDVSCDGVLTLKTDREGK